MAQGSKPVICHLGAWGNNWGDRAIQYALQNAVGREEYEWRNVDIQAPDWASRFMYGNDGKSCDLLVIGGGGLLWDKPELKSPSGWQWQIEPKVLANWQHPPIIVHAIGDTRFPYGDDQTGEGCEFQESLEILSQKALSFSVRDELTQRILAEMDIKTTLCPDPALFISEPRTKVPDGPPILGVCLAWDKAPWRWPGRLEGAATFVEYMDEVSEALAGFVLEGWQILPFCHIEQDAPTVTLCERLVGRRNSMAEFSACDRPTAQGIDLLVGSYAECTAVISMRKHGVIIPAGLGVPVVGLGDHAEVGSICSQLGISVMTTENASAECLVELVQLAMAHPPDVWGRLADPSVSLRAAHDRHILKIRRALA